MSVAIVAAAVATAYAAVGTALAPTPPVTVISAAPLATSQGTLALANPGTSAVTVSSITRVPCDDSGMAIAMPTGSFAVAAGSQQNVTFDCPPTPVFGMRRCTYHAQSAAMNELASFMGVCATSASSALSPSKTPIALSAQVGATQTEAVTITSSGSNAIGRLQLQVTDLTGTILLGAPCNPDANGCDLSNTAIDSFPVDIVCHPSAETTVNADLYVVDQFGEQLSAPLPISCTGVAGSTQAIAIETSPAPLDLGAVEVLGGSATGALRIKNVGPAGTLSLDTIAVSGAGTDWTFTLGSPCNGMLPCFLAPGESLDLAVKLTPSELGRRDATLTIASNDPNNSQVVVRLYGTGQGALLERAAGQAMTVDLGQVQKNASVSLPIRFANRGNRDVTDVSLALAGSPQLTTMPAAPTSTFTVVHGATPTNVMLTCTPGGVTGTFTTTLTASAPDTIGSTPITITATCRGVDSVLAGSPSSLQLGEVRVGATPATAAFSLDNVGSNALTLAQAPQIAPATGFTLTGPASLAIAAGGSAAAQLVVTPESDGPIAGTITANDTSGNNALAIPVAGTAVTASATAPSTMMLGTFCVNEPTTATTVSLAASGTATIGVSAPTMGTAPSRFQVLPRFPTSYPATLPPGATAVVEVLPMREGSAALVSEDVVWATDIEADPHPRTTVTAQFLAAGAAIAPASLAFGAQPIHLFIKDAQPVTIQNCSGPTLAVHPSIDAPFSIDSDFPTQLVAAETATFAVGFHPTKNGTFTGHLRITTSDQQVLDVALSGIGSASSTPADAGPGPPVFRDTSFYACSCTSSGPGGVIPVTLALLAVLVPRRRRRL